LECQPPLNYREEYLRCSPANELNANLADGRAVIFVENVDPVVETFGQL
jgi:hypothetical protein